MRAVRGRAPMELVAFLVLLFVVPARLVVPGFGAAGSPSSLVGFGMFVVLALAHLYPRAAPSGADRRRPLANPVTVALLGLGAFLLLSWLLGKTRPLSPLGSTTSDRALITMVSLLGVALFVISRIRSWSSVVSIVDLLVYGSTFMAVIGLIQFFTGFDASRLLTVPGLSSNTDGFAGAIPTRSIFNRPFGTALHPIEFGVVAAGAVPVAIWRAMTGNRTRLWLCLAVLGFSTMTALSRSAVLALAVSVIVMLLGFSWRQRINLCVGATTFVVASGAVVPGLVGTLRSLFSQAGGDPSVQARLDRTPEVIRLIAEHPWLGRGFGTYTPEEYLLLDNEIQKFAIENGLVGVAVLVSFALGIVWAAHNVARRDERCRDLATVLAASILGVLVSWYTFDAFFYHILTGTLFVHVGLVGVLWNLSRRDPEAVDIDLVKSEVR